MKRDMELVRQILMIAEDASPDERFHTMRIEGHSDATVGKHVELLEDAGYIEADLVHTEERGTVSGRVLRITWAGYEFLDAARSETLWRKAREQVGEKLGSVPVEVLKQLLIRLASNALGL
jgi:DNA-binding transcriptional ArsR family regulator